MLINRLLQSSKPRLGYSVRASMGFHPRACLASPPPPISRAFAISSIPNDGSNNSEVPHFQAARKISEEVQANDQLSKGRMDYLISQSPWTKEEAESVKILHEPPTKIVDKLAYHAVQISRRIFDFLSGYNPDKVPTSVIINRIVFLETVAGVPGMVGGSLRHLRSLRLMQRDQGWINSLLSEAENERMHLLTFMHVKRPNVLFRGLVWVAQGVVWNFMFVMYLACPRMAHKFVGYLEEEAVKTYTGIIERLDKGQNNDLRDMEVPSIAKDYWKLGEDCTMRDLLLQIRADEAHHRHANHTFSELEPTDVNPFNHGFPKLTEIQYSGARGRHAEKTA